MIIICAKKYFNDPYFSDKIPDRLVYTKNKKETKPVNCVGQREQDILDFYYL